MAKAPTTRGGTYSGGGNQSNKKSEDGYSQDESNGWGDGDAGPGDDSGDGEPLRESKPVKKGAAALIAEALRMQSESAGISRADDEPFRREKEDLYQGSRPGEESQDDGSLRKAEAVKPGKDAEGSDKLRDLSAL